MNFRSQKRLLPKTLSLELIIMKMLFRLIPRQIIAAIFKRLFICSSMIALPSFAMANSMVPIDANKVGEVILGLLLVLAIFFISIWMIKKLSQTRFSGETALKIIAVVTLGQKEKVVVIQHHQKEILLGVTANSIALLDSMPVASMKQDCEADSFSATDPQQPSLAQTIKPNSPFFNQVTELIRSTTK